MKDTLKEMLLDIIGGKEEAAAEKLHCYFVQKSRQVTGLSEEELSEEEIEEIISSASEEELEEAVRAGFQSDASSTEVQRPRSQAERDSLARNIKNNRARNRARVYPGDRQYAGAASAEPTKKLGDGHQSRENVSTAVNTRDWRDRRTLSGDSSASAGKR